MDGALSAAAGKRDGLASAHNGMLPRINRLTKKNDFDAVFEKGKGMKKDFLAFRLMKNTLRYSRFGFIVSKKVSLKAVDRNLIKRRLRSIISKRIDDIKTPADVIIVVLPAAQNKTFDALEKAVNEVINSLT